MAVKFLDLHGQYLRHQTELDAAIQRVIRNSSFIGGAEVEAFEQEFAEWLGARHCVGCANGTDAIEILLEALGIGVGDEVIVPAMTWISTSEAVTSIGAVPVFSDILPGRFTMDPEDVARKMTDKTRAIIPVHLYGLAAEMDALLGLAQKHGLKVLEDCAQAQGAEYRGRKVGILGDGASFSFYPGKNLGAYGDAGAMVTNDAEVAQRVKLIARHGQFRKHEHLLEGRSSRLDGMQAAVLRAKLPYLNDWTEIRRRTAEMYQEILSGTQLQLPGEPENCRHVYHLFVVRSDQRDKLREFLSKRGIESSVHYPVALPFTRVYQERFGHGPEDFPSAFMMQSSILSLPMGEHMTEEMVAEVGDAIQEFETP